MFWQRNYLAANFSHSRCRGMSCLHYLLDPLRYVWKRRLPCDYMANQPIPICGICVSRIFISNNQTLDVWLCNRERVLCLCHGMRISAFPLAGLLWVAFSSVVTGHLTCVWTTGTGVFSLLLMWDAGNLAARLWTMPIMGLGSVVMLVFTVVWYAWQEVWKLVTSSLTKLTTLTTYAPIRLKVSMFNICITVAPKAFFATWGMDTSWFVVICTVAAQPEVGKTYDMNWGGK